MGLEGNQIARLIFLLILLISISGWVFISARKNLNKTIQSALIWILIFVGLIASYGLWEEIKNNLLGQKSLLVSQNGVYEIEKSIDGHFYILAELDETVVEFLIDTGASGTIVSLNDAKKMGITTNKLKFINPVKTANGITYTANYSIKNFEFLDTTLGEKEIQIADHYLFKSLLGMDIIGAAKIFAIRGNKLHLSF